MNDLTATGIIVGNCRGSDLLSRMIEYRAGRYSHSTTLMTGGRQVLDSRFWGGVAVRKIAYLKSDYIDWLFLPCTPRQCSDYYEALTSQLGAPYDMAGICGFLTGSIKDRNFRNKSAWFCDELIVWALEQSKRIPQLIYTPNLIDPGGLALILSTAGAFPIKMMLRNGAYITYA